MTVEDFCAAYPRLYHMAEASMWPSIQRHGLLSTSALLDLYGATGPARVAIERQRRPDFMAVEHATLGRVLIRDQKPMTDATLAPVLIDMTPAEWYALLNERVFFWVSEERLKGLLGAYRHRDNLVLVLDNRHRAGPARRADDAFHDQLRLLAALGRAAGAGDFPAVGRLPARPPGRG